MKLIDKAALVAEIERKKDKITFLNEFANGTKFGLQTAIDIIDTLGVREVDWDFAKEVDVWVRDNGDTNGFFNVQELAKHFFELGISVSNKAEKGEEV